MEKPVTDVSWRLLIDPPGDPAANMARDEEIADQARRGIDPPTLRIYRWDRPAISLGRRQNLDGLSLALRFKKLPIIRRVTGGGAVLHRLDELTYSIAAPRQLLPGKISLKHLVGVLHWSLREALIRRRVADPKGLTWVSAEPGCQGLPGAETFCFTHPVCGDLLWQGRKVAGASLRVWREAFLIQGSLQGLSVLQETVQEALLDAVVSSLHARWAPQPLRLLS